ncbi:MAG: hypothetical protein U1E14_06405 [Geminicoccaceae bacterium]
MRQLAFMLAACLVAGSASAASDPGRTPVTQVYEQLILGIAAARQCPQAIEPPLTPEQTAQVDRNLATVGAVIVRQAMAAHPDQSWMTVQARFDRIRAGIEQRAAAQVQKLPCQSPPMAELLALHRYHATWDATAANLQGG